MSELELNYQLAELPSAQHRAGLAGLVLMVEYLHQQFWFAEQQHQGAIAQIKNLNEFGATLQLNLQGLKALFDLTYQAFEEERFTETKIKKFDRVEEVEVTDDKGKTKLVNRYYYKVTVPDGAFLPDCDRSSDNAKQKIWVKLWRDMLWQIVRGVPATRNPFTNRVNGNNIYSKDAEQLWNELQHPEKTTGQSGNYYLGAMALNAENVPTKDRVRYQFLLHFWVFVAQVYCPATLNKDGKRELAGYALAIPDVANLRNFCAIFRQVLESRRADKWGYLPREAVIDLPQEGALDLLLLLRDRISRETGDQQIRRMVLGIELIHAEKVGNSGVKIRSISQVEPIKEQIDRYEQIKDAYWCPWFRKQRLLNLLQEDKPAWYEFDSLLSRIPRKWLEDPYFSHDAKQIYTDEVPKQGEEKMETKVRHYADIVYKVCQSYVSYKLKNKYKMEWDKSKKVPLQDGRPIPQKDFDDKKENIVNDAFLSVRSRTEKKVFIDYFVSTLYPFVREEEFADFADKLFNQTDEIRALTLLALSSQFPLSKKSDSNNSEIVAA